MDTACILLTFICFYACNSSHVYYLDATSGSDQNNGTSPRSAWQSLEHLKQISLQPGDKILLKKGETFPGILELTGKGTYTHPIIIDAYGEGNQKPCIAGNDTSMYAVRISIPITSQFKTLKSVIQGKNERPDVPD